MLIDAEIMAENRNPRWRLSAILDFRKSVFLSTWTPWAADFLSRCKNWCKNVDRRRYYSPKSKSKMAAIRHLGFPNTWFLRTGSLWAADFPSRNQNLAQKMLIDAEIMAQHRNPRWRPSSILELLHHHIGPPSKSPYWATSACQILC